MTFFMKAKVKTIKQKVIIQLLPKKFTTPMLTQKNKANLPQAKATGKAVVGGKFTAWDGYIFGKYLELDDGKRVVQEWTSTDFPEG